MMMMIETFCILASTKGDRLVRISGGFKSGGYSQTMIYILLSVLGVVALVMIIYQGIIAYRRLRKRLEPGALFDRVSSDIGATREQQMCLKRIARYGKLETPLTLLISPSTFDFYAEKYTGGMSGDRGGRVAGVVAETRSQLFS